MSFTHALATNRYGEADLIVSTSAANGTHTTLASAMAAATAGQTIFLRDSVTENVTITPGVNIAAWSGDSLNTPTITGKITMTGAGTSTISGIKLTTNSDNIIVVSGSNASILNLVNCYLNMSNNTGITFSSSSSSAQINIKSSYCDLGTTGIKIFDHTSAGSLNIFFSRFINTGASTTASTASAGGITTLFSTFQSAITTSGTNAFGARIINIDTAGINTTALTIGGSGSNAIYNSYISCGSASTISVSSTVIVADTTLASTNTNNVTGAGTFSYSSVTWQNGSVFNPTTVNRGTFDGGEYQGRNTNTAPSAGMLGEQVRSYVNGASAVSLTVSGTAYDITSISLTAGIWDVSCVADYSGVAVTGTNYRAAISTTSATMGTVGDNDVATPTSPNTNSGMCLVIPQYRITLSSTTTVYMVARAIFTVGTPTVFGRLSAVRVA